MRMFLGQKDNEGKLPYELISPYALEHLAKVLQMGAEKYDERNWEKGIPYSKLFGAMLRHIFSWWMGADEDEESGLHPLAHAMFHCMAILHFESLKEEGLDDRPYNR